MPLRTGSSQKVVSSNMRELVDTYRSSGRIGSSRPANKTAAIKQAIAISLNKSKEAKRMAAGGPVEERRKHKQLAAIRKKGGSITYKKDGRLPVGVY